MGRQVEDPPCEIKVVDGGRGGSGGRKGNLWGEGGDKHRTRYPRQADWANVANNTHCAPDKTRRGLKRPNGDGQLKLLPPSSPRLPPHPSPPSQRESVAIVARNGHFGLCRRHFTSDPHPPPRFAGRSSRLTWSCSTATLSGSEITSYRGERSSTW